MVNQLNFWCPCLAWHWGLLLVEQNGLRSHIPVNTMVVTMVVEDMAVMVVVAVETVMIMVAW